MITFDVLIMTMPEFERSDVEQWVTRDWVRPDRQSDDWLFDEVDIARMRLIAGLRDDLSLDEPALSLVLHLLDQLYDARRSLCRLHDALEGTPGEIRAAMLTALKSGR